MINHKQVHLIRYRHYLECFWFFFSSFFFFLNNSIPCIAFEVYASALHLSASTYIKIPLYPKTNMEKITKSGYMINHQQVHLMRYKHYLECFYCFFFLHHLFFNDSIPCIAFEVYVSALHLSASTYIKIPLYPKTSMVQTKVLVAEYTKTLQASKVAFINQGFMVTTY